MNARLAWGALILLMALLASVFLRSGTEETIDATPVDTAQAAPKPFKQRLKSALLEGMARGPEQAIDFCRLEAPRIAKSIVELETSDEMQQAREDAL